MNPERTQRRVGSASVACRMLLTRRMNTSPARKKMRPEGRPAQSKGRHAHVTLDEELAALIEREQSLDDATPEALVMANGGTRNLLCDREVRQRSRRNRH